MIVFLFFSLLLAVTSGSARITPPLFPRGLLIDGKSVEIEEVPYLAIIEHAGRPVCAGAIIAKEKILTSARCLMHLRPWSAKYKIRVGSSSRNTTDGRYPIVQYFKLHECYAGTYESMEVNRHQVPVNDLAMIFTAPMDFDTKSKPIPLFDEAESVPHGTEALIT